MIRFLLYTVVFWGLFGPVYGQFKETARWVSESDDFRGVDWRFQPGDSLQWANPAYQPAHWAEKSPEQSLQDNKALWKAGRGWYRMAFKIRRKALSKDIYLVVRQYGSSEIYLDGRRLVVIKPVNFDSGGSQYSTRLIPFRFPDTSRHVLAIRYQFRRDPVLFRPPNVDPISLKTEPAGQVGVNLVREARWTTTFTVCFASVFSALALLHFLFYRANRTQRINRTLGWMMLGFALGFICAELIEYGHTLTQLSVLETLENLALCAGFVLLLTAAYDYLHLRLGWVYRIILALYVITLLADFFAGESFDSPTQVPTLLVIIDYVRVSWLGRKRRDADARLPWNSLKVALYCFLLMLIYIVVGAILEGLTNSDFDEAILFPVIILAAFALLSIPVGLSLSLVRDYARTYKALGDNLREVEQLSARTLAQEQEKQQLLAQQNEYLEQQVQERTAALNQSLEDLKATQAQLVQREKLASLGELTAGIAHEIQNPLNFVNNFAEVSVELVGELREERARGAEKDEALEEELLDDLGQNVQKISEHGKRAASIVRGMLQHSRASSGQKEPTDLNALVDEYLRLAYHGLRAKDKAFNAQLVTDFAADLSAVNLVQEDVGRVLVNLFNNAFYAVQQKTQSEEARKSGFQPTVWAQTAKEDGTLVIRIRDNGMGIPDEVKHKVFQPFFTTKPTGQGTGLGLSLSYDIITKGHGGSLSVTTEPGEFTEFTIRLPIGL